MRSIRDEYEAVWNDECEKIMKKYRKRRVGNTIWWSLGLITIVAAFGTFSKIHSGKVKLYTQSATIINPKGENTEIIEQVENPKEDTLISVTSKWEKTDDYYYQTTKRYLVESNNKVEMTEEELMELIKNENNPFEKLFGEPVEQIVEKKKELTDIDEERNFTTASIIKYNYDKNEYVETEKWPTKEEVNHNIMDFGILVAICAAGVTMGTSSQKLDQCEKQIRKEIRANQTFSNDQ